MFVRYAYDNQESKSGSSPRTNSNSRPQPLAQHRGRGELGRLELHGERLPRACPEDTRCPRPSPTNYDLQRQPSVGHDRAEHHVAAVLPAPLTSFYDTFYINTPRHDFKVGGDFTFAHHTSGALLRDGAFAVQHRRPFDATTRGPGRSRSRCSARRSRTTTRTRLPRTSRTTGAVRPRPPQPGPALRPGDGPADERRLPSTC